MRILKPGHYKYVLFFLVFAGAESFAQQSAVTVDQDPKFEQLLKEKRKIYPGITMSDRYRIQIYYGNNDSARKSLAEFKRDHDDMDATIVFESPTYKVWVGSFKTLIEAERNLAEIRKDYPYALLIKPKS